MSHQNFNFHRACRLVSIKVINTDEELVISKTFRILNKSNIGLLLFFLLGLVIGVLATTQTDDLIFLLIGSIMGFGLAIISFISILAQATDYFKISNKQIAIRSNLRSKKKELKSDYKVQIKRKTEFIKLKSQPGSGTYFRFIDIYITRENEKQLIIDFQVDNRFSEDINRLGNEISSMIKTRINSV